MRQLWSLLAFATLVAVCCEDVGVDALSASRDDHADAGNAPHSDAATAKLREPVKRQVLECGEEVIVYEVAPSGDAATRQSACVRNSSADGVKEEEEDEDAFTEWSTTSIRITQPRGADDTREISHVLLRAPVHTCTIKYYPGLKEFLKTYPRIPRLEVGAYSQPPNLSLYSLSFDVIEAADVTMDASPHDIAAYLRSRGLTVRRPQYEPGAVVA